MTGTLQKRAVSATVTTNVAVDPEVAFAVFTEEIGAWWLRGPRYRSSASPGASTMTLEPKLGGRVIETFEDGRDPFVLGKIVAWDPPNRFVLEWRLSNFAPDEATEVDVRFDRTDSGTCVVVTHSGFHDLRADHPARHGKDGIALSTMIGRWWAEQASSFRLRALAAKTR